MTKQFTSLVECIINCGHGGTSRIFIVTNRNVTYTETVEQLRKDIRIFVNAKADRKNPILVHYK